MLGLRSKIPQVPKILKLVKGVKRVTEVASTILGVDGLEFMKEYPGPPAHRLRKPPVVRKWVRGVGWEYIRSRKILPESEKLGSKWNMTNVRGVVKLSNTASYAGVVQRSSTQDKEFHAPTGWRTEVDMFLHFSKRGKIAAAYKAAILQVINS